MKLSIFAATVIATIFAATNLHAITLTDTNSNGMSDFWEKHWNNGSLFSNTFLPTADPDGDGWNNLTESIAGTNPNDPQPPTGLVQTKIVESPAAQTMEEEVAKAFVISWPTVIGKQYKLLVSSDLSPGSWVLFDQPMMGTGSEIQIAIEPLNEDGTRPTRLFWRVSADDTDTDGDSLSDYEETAKVTNPLKADTDGDGLPDNTDPAPLASATVADPDGLNLPSSIGTNLRGFWDFESQNNGTTVPAIFPDRSGANRHATANSGGPQPYGMPSKAAKIGAQYMNLPVSTFQGQATWTISGWIKFTKGGIQNGSTGKKFVYALYDRTGTGAAPQKAILAQGNVFTVEKVGTNEVWFVGGYKQTTYNNEYPYTNGNAKAIFDGYTFSLPLGTTGDGEWHQFVVTRGNVTNGQRVYFDGSLVFNNTNQGLRDFTVDYDSDTYFTLGHTYPGYIAGQLPEAYIDRLRVHSKLLTDADVAALYHQDIDRDGLWDVTENSTGLWRDANSNGIQDLGETNYIVSPFVAQPVGDDADNDGLSNILEQTIGTKIANPDTDGDFMPDGWEYKYSSMAATSSLMMAAAATPPVGYLDPLVADAAGDLDGDGVSNLNEYRYACDPRSKDTDGDGKNDNVEIGQGSGPDDPSDGGNPIPAAQRFSAVLGIGDKSGSKSEDYIMNCFRIDPETGEEKRIYTLRSGGFGEYKEETQSIFKKGETYTFQIDWQSSKLTSRPSSPGVSAEGPDFDYTFKVEPQGTGAGYLVDSWNKSKSIVESPILAVDASDVATSAAEFTEKYESKRVAIVNLKVEWQSPYGDAELSTHNDPWTNQANGQRWFPDSPSPKVEQFRDLVNVKVTGGLPKMKFWLRGFDVDDTTASSADPDGVVDTTGDDGGDNQTLSARDMGVSPNGNFLGPETAAFGRSGGAFDSTGKSVTQFRVGISPGNNYRVTASAKSKAELEDLYTTIAENEPSKVISPNSSQSPTFSGGISPTLTIWRRLWVENDSMAAETVTTGSEKNFLDVQVASVAPYTDIPSMPNMGQIVVNQEILSVHDFYTGGRFVPNNGQGEWRVAKTNSSPGIIYTDELPTGVAGWARLYDDDGRGVLANQLPRIDLIDDNLKKYFKPAFIELKDPGNDNTNKIVQFRKNEDPYSYSTVVDDCRDLTDSPSTWSCLLVAAFQGGDLERDNDPNGEDKRFGDTDTGSMVSPLEKSVVFVETCREAYQSFFEGPNNARQISFRSKYYRFITGVAAHEMGHQPGNQSEGEDHDEDELMLTGMANFDDTNYSTKFSAKTLTRFRKSKTWTK